ncbi:hypothetical protein ACROYT_G004643 [Oculina patagonica]
MSYSNGLLQSNNTNITPIKGPRGEKGDPGVGFDVTPEGNFNLNKKRVIGLKTPDDVAIDDSIENYSRDLETAVNKRYLNQFFLKKNRNETVFDCAGLSLQNTEVYYPSLYNDRSVPNVGYVSVEDNKVRTEIDTKLATKADKSYADNTYLTKKSGGVLAQNLKNKADKSYVDNTFLKKVVGRVLTQKILSKLDIHGSNMMQANLDMNDNRITNLSKPIYETDGVNKLYVDSSHITSIDKGNVFNNIMIDSDNQLSDENDIELGDLIHHPNPVHQINKKAIYGIAEGTTDDQAVNYKQLDIKNGAISNGCVNQENVDKTKPSCNGDVCNGTVMNGITHSDTVRQRHKETSSNNSASHENVSETVSGEANDTEEENVKVVGYLNLLANSIDNFTHGLAVAGSFIVSTKVGMCTTCAILLHEVPHEIGDFAILLKSGFRRWDAAVGQMITASAGLAGAVFGLVAEHAGDSTAWVLPFTSGGFIYIALVTIVPDLLQETRPRESIKQLLMMLAGIASMGLVSFIH